MKKFTLLIFVSLLSFLAHAQLPPEGFETAWTIGTPPAPTGWTVINEQGPTVTWTRNNPTNTLQPAHTGQYAAYLDRENVLPNAAVPKDWLITPYFNMPVNGTLRFFSRLTTPGDQGSIYKVKISTDPDPANLAAYTDMQVWTETQINPTQAEYYEKVITLPNITGDVHIAFVMEGVNKDRWLIDDVKVVSQCFAPTNLTANTPTLTGITLDWVNTGGATSWNIEIVPDYASPTGAVTNYNGQPPYTTTVLNPDSAYKAYITAVCSDGGTSEVVGPVFFNTAALGESCANPLVITPPPYTTTNNTSNFADNYEGVAGTGCNASGNYLSGNDVIYSYTPTANENLNINLSGTGTGAGMFIYSSCANIGISCIAGGTGNSTPIDIPSLAVTANTTIYIVISTTTSAQTTPYTLTIQKVSCAAPTGLAANNATATSADLTWAAGTATSWQVAVQNSGSGLPLGAGQNVTQNTITSTQTLAGAAFTSSSNYEYYVRANCGDGTYSIWAGPFQFATTQIPAGLNYTQDWETIPHGWTLNNGNLTNKWVVGTAASNGGTHSLYISNDNGLNNTYSTTSNTTVHAFRDIAIPANSNQLNLAFDWRNIGEVNWDFIRVYLIPVSTTPVVGTQLPTSPAGGVKIGGDLVSSASWTTSNNVVNAAPYSGTTMRLVFEWKSDTSGGSQPPAAIDNINFSIITCPAPTNPVMAANGLTATQAIINWTAPAQAPASGYEYYLGSTQTAPTATTTISGTAATATTPVTIVPSSANYFWVRANCGPNDKSTWAGPLYFVAPQIPAGMDYTQNFDSGNHEWSLNNGTQANKWTVGSATSNSPANSLYISEDNGVTNTYNINAASVVQAYRDIQMPATLDQLELTYDWKSTGESAVDYFRVWLVPTDFVPTPGTQITAGTGRLQIGGNSTQSTTWVNSSNIIQASTYGGTVRRLVFEWRNSATLGTQPPAAIDNINLKVIPCPQPSAIVLSALSQSAASFTWTPPTSGAPGYDYYISTTNTAPANTETGVATPTASVTVNNLPTSTQHYIWVRSSCSTTSKSYWIGPLAFITPQVPAMMDYVQNFDNGAHGFQLVNGTQTNKWVVGSAVSNTTPNSLYISNDNGVNNGYTITAASVVHAYRDITFPAAIDDAILSFDWKNVGEANVDYFRIWLVPVDFNPTTGTQITAGTGRTQLGGNFSDNSVWTTANITFSAIANQGQTRRLIFEWRNTASGGTQPPAAIDNINLYKVTCPVPSNLAMTSNTSAGTSFSWTAPTSVSPTYDYYYSTSPTPPGATTTPSGNVATPSATLSGLIDSSNLNIWVRSNCGPGSTSLWIGPLQFNTPQIPSSLNYNQNFDDNIYGWSINNGTQVNKWVVGTAAFNSPGKSLYISNTLGQTNNYNISSGSVVHAYKDFIIPTGTAPLDFSFDWKNMGEINDYVRVWRVPTTFVPTPGTQITAAADRVLMVTPLYNKNTWTNSSTTLDPTGFAGTNVRIVFEWVNNTFTANQAPAAIDNIDFSVITCPRPTSQAVDAVTQSGATFNWFEAGTATTWEVYVVEAGQPSPTAETIGIPADNKPFQYTTPELDPSTNYVYYVRSVCNPTNKSKWTGPVPFRTSIANDECVGAYTLGVNDEENPCLSSAVTSYVGATTSPQPYNCGGTNGADIWYEFVAIGERHNIELSEFVAVAGIPQPIVIELYEGEQCGVLQQVECSSINVLAARNLIPGNTYKVRLYINSATPDLNTAFKVCINTPKPLQGGATSACAVTTINYNFEQPTPFPVVTPPSPFPAMIHHNTVQGWRTTAPDGIIEFWPPINMENKPAYDGGQFVELNANVVAGLYQDYATPNATTFTYKFAHMGRSCTDSCQLLAGSPDQPTSQYVVVTTATTGVNGWIEYTGTYTSTQPVTRFIFQSTSQCNGDGSIGNFLDGIQFTANNSVISYGPENLNCIDNVLSVVAAGSGEWSEDPANPAETIVTDFNDPNTTITGFTVSGTYKYHWTTEYCSSEFEVIYDAGDVPAPIVTTPVNYCIGATPAAVSATALADHTLSWFTVPTGGVADAAAPTPDASVLGTTTYYVSQTAPDGCVSPRAAIEVIVSAIPNAPAATTPYTYCQNATASPLTATVLVGNTLNWYTTATGGTASTTAPTPDTTVAGEMSYWVSQLSAGGCEGDRTKIDVTVNPSVIPVTGFSYAVTSICIEEENPVVIPVADFTTGGTFSGDAGLIINPVSGEINLGASTPGLHTVTYTVNPNPANCNPGGTTSVTITITPLAVAQTGFTYATPVCSGTVNQAPILASGFTTGGTFTADAGLSIDPVTGEINVAASNAGSFTITYTVDQSVPNCVEAGTGISSIVITQQFTPVTAFDYDNSFCFGASDASPNLAADFTTGGTFTGSNGLVIDSTTGLVNIAASTSGEHIVTYTFEGDAVNCISGGTSSYPFTIGSELGFGFEGECQGTAFVITASPENGSFDDNDTSLSFVWKTASGTPVGNDTFTFNVSDYVNSTPETDTFPMELFLTVNVNGCETTRSYTVEGIGCTIQKGISPNNDGKNDSFDLQYMGVKKLSIFNRYGQEVYTKGNYTNEWIGQGSNGDELPTGTYYYVIVRTAGGTETGWIYINRQE